MLRQSNAVAVRNLAVWKHTYIIHMHANMEKLIWKKDGKRDNNRVISGVI